MEENNKGLIEFSDAINIDKNISEKDRTLIEMKIWQLLAYRTERYTMGDSTSVPVEMAEELFKSLWFSIGLELKNLRNPMEALMKEDLNDLLKASWSRIEDMIAEGKELLEEVIKTSPHIENISYNDTLKEIGESFKKYYYRFFAHNMECSIDYQISNDVSESLQGIEYVNEYLKALLTENEFCRGFHRDKIVNVLNSYCQDYKGLLINIFEPVLANVIALDILRCDIFDLEVSSLQRKMLFKIFMRLSKAEILEELRSSVDRVCDKLGIFDNEKIEYIKKTSMNMYPRIEVGLATGSLENIFLSFKYEETPKETMFIDNETMDDEKLRDLIKEIKDCRFISDKVAMVQEQVKSVRDLVEILNECFWGDDSLELFKAISKNEIYLIKYYLDKKGQGYTSDSAWETKFKYYISQI